MSDLSLDRLVADFGAAATSALSNPVVDGQPEDQLRTPLNNLLYEVGVLSGFGRDVMSVVGETSLAELRVRPDFAVTVRGALVGHVEVKAPGKGADPRRFTDKHDKEQWKKLQALPNLVYTDGNAFSLWRDGELVGDVVHLGGDVRTDGRAVTAPPALLWTLQQFLGWTPQPPRSVRQLADVSARLCRLLRDEVEEQMGRGNDALTHLADGWRRLLFPTATDAEFADGYAQAVTFGLLLARARDISFDDGLGAVARQLRDRSSLIGSALGLLTDEAEDLASLDTSLDTMRRVLGVVDWSKLVSKAEARKPPGERADPWLYFYEDFLAEYDNALRKQTGSYYTPPEVVREMARLVDDVLRSPARFGLARGLADGSVTVADPAVGAGTFLLAVLRRIAATLADDEGPGAMRRAVPDVVRRLIGFELQFGPFAVAQLRLTGEVADLMTPPDGDPPGDLPDLPLFVTDTLGNPFTEKEDAWVDARLRPLAESRRQADEVKRKAPITVVIGNPPYKEKAKGLGGWVEVGDKKGAAPLDAWQPPAAWNAGAHAKHLRNLYVYFWRWATWKVFGSGRALTQAEADAGHPREGVVCYITVAGFLAGPGFQKMRADLRRDCSEIWVVDCSPEGHQPPVASRVFQGVQQPVCIVLAARAPDADDDTPARVRYVALPEGRREAKFEALTALDLDGDGWTDCPDAWRGPFLPAATGDWAGYPSLDDLFVYDGSGVMPGRTWPIAPDEQTLRDRWNRLIRERDLGTKEDLFRPHMRNGALGDKHVGKEETTGGLPGHESRSMPVAEDTREAVRPMRYGYRSFDRQWIIPDKRLLNQVNPTLWEGHSTRQVYLTALTRTSPSSGPAVTLTGLVPDMDHYKGSFGGRIYPLWRDTTAETPNVNPNLLGVLAEAYGQPVGTEDIVGYLAAVLAHPSFAERFEDELAQPGLRVPITADAALFAEAVRLGREVVWLHTFGDRFADGRPAGAPRVEDGPRPRVPEGGDIHGEVDAIGYDASRQRLTVGPGYVENVRPEVWAYEVSGKQVLTQWFSYRRHDRSRPLIGSRRPPSALNDIQPDAWLSEYTSELLNVLHVLTRLVDLEPAQADLLARICDGPTLDADALRAEGAFDAPGAAPRRTAPVDPAQQSFL